MHIDKPGSGTSEEFKKLLDIAKEKNLIVQLAYMYRYNLAIQKTFENKSGKRKCKFISCDELQQVIAESLNKRNDELGNTALNSQKLSKVFIPLIWMNGQRNAVAGNVPLDDFKIQ